MSTAYAHVPSPLGQLLVVVRDGGIAGVYFPEHRRGPLIEATWVRNDGPAAALAEQLTAYFDGALRDFDVVLAPTGTAFQQEVWSALRAVGFGATTTYAALAAAIGRPTAARAVAGAVARNPVSVVIPCHRVVGAGGALTGYAGGLDRKRHLLDLEARA
jgi:methylated-DNA-[protein]-cysteine S-methyltransferase